MREREYDAHNKICRRKRQIAVDTNGRLLAVNLTPADMPIHLVRSWFLMPLSSIGRGSSIYFDDAAYARRAVLDKADYLDFAVEVVRGLQGQDGFQVQLRRWVVERTFAWLMRYRCVVRDYEQCLDVSEAMIFIALGSSLLRKISFL